MYVTFLMLHLVSLISSPRGTGVSSFSLNIRRSSFRLPQLFSRLRERLEMYELCVLQKFPSFLPYLLRTAISKLAR